MRSLTPSRRLVTASVVIALLWAGWQVGTIRVVGCDLAPLYLAGRLVQKGQFNRIYETEGDSFNRATSDAWLRETLDAGLTIVSTRYIYVPIVAWSLGPLARTTSFWSFCELDLFINLAAIIGLVVLCARLWQPRLLHPQWFALCLVLLSLSEPLHYALWLGQTVPVMLCAIVAALFLAERQHPTLAGMVLALPIVVKLTPVIFLGYWLWKRNGRAIAACLATVAAAALANLAVAGPRLVLAYLRIVRNISGHVILAFNNQSIPAWLARLHASRGAMFHWRLTPVTPEGRIVAALALAVSLGVVALALFLSRNDARAQDGVVLTAAFLLPLLFSPLAWTHYYVALLMPVVLLSREARERRWLLIPLVVVVALNFRPFAVNPLVYPATTWVSAHLLAGIICFVAVCLAASLPARSETASAGIA